MLEIELTVVTRNEGLANELRSFGDDGVTIAEGVTVSYRGERILEAEGAPEILHLALQIAEISATLAAPFIATWLNRKFKGRTEKVVMNRHKIEIIKIEESEIKQIVEEHIEKSSQS